MPVDNKIITYVSEDHSALAEYVIHFMLNAIGCVARQVVHGSSSGRIDLYYGNSPDVDAVIRIPRRPHDLVWQELIRGTIRPLSSGQIPFDIIAATANLITDQVNESLPPDCYDAHKRLYFARSFQGRSGIGHLPLVDLYVAVLKDLVCEKLGITGLVLWPEGKRCAVGLSHDVDVPDRFGVLQMPFFARGKDITWHLALNKRKAKAIFDWLTLKDGDSYWLFDLVMEEEAKRGFSSTFFFASTNRLSDVGTRFDVDYDVRWPRFRTLFAKIKAGGFEIALHAGYNACTDPEVLAKEKQILQDIAGVQVLGIRHHFWHLGQEPVKTLRSHEQVGFGYDSSLAFRDHLGFRRSVSIPFYPWDPERRRAIGVLQLPPLCKDAHVFVFSEPKKDADRLSALKECITMLKTTGGLGVIDWHNRTSYPKPGKYEKWGRAYLDLLDWLAADKQIWVTNLGAIFAWLKQRQSFLVARDAFLGQNTPR